MTTQRIRPQITEEAGWFGLEDRNRFGNAAPLHFWRDDELTYWPFYTRAQAEREADAIAAERQDILAAERENGGFCACDITLREAAIRSTGGFQWDGAPEGGTS